VSFKIDKRAAHVVQGHGHASTKLWKKLVEYDLKILLKWEFATLTRSSILDTRLAFDTSTRHDFCKSNGALDEVMLSSLKF